MDEGSRYGTPGVDELEDVPDRRGNGRTPQAALGRTRLHVRDESQEVREELLCRGVVVDEGD